MNTFDERADSSMILSKDSVQSSAGSAFRRGTFVIQHSRHVRRVEELDWVGSALSTESVALDGNLDAESLKVDDEGEHGNGRDEVHDVRETLAVERFLERATLVVPGEEEVEQGDEGTLELGSSTSVDRRRREGFPHDRLADVGRDEEVDSGSETVSLLEELIEEDDDQGSDDELEDEEEADTSSKIGRLPVESSEDVDRGLTESDEESENCHHHRQTNSVSSAFSFGSRQARTLLSSTEKSPVLLEGEVDVDQASSLKKLDDHARRDDGRDTEFHEGTPVRRENDTHPIQRIYARATTSESSKEAVEREGT